MRASPFRRRGVAIVLAMGTVALAAMAATAIMVTQSTWARTDELSAYRTQAESLIGAGVDWGRAVLYDDRRQSNVDYLGEPWALRLAPMPVDNGVLGGYMEDEQGRFNLNNLAPNGAVDPNQLAHFGRLLSLLGFPDAQNQALAAALADWLEAAGEQRAGTEDSYYSAMQPPYLPANRPLTDLDELALVRGFDAAALARLRPYVSALPRATAVNVNTAPAEVLAAVIPGLTMDDARALLVRRDRAYFRDPTDFASALPSGITATAGDIAVGSDFFRITLRVSVGDAEADGEALLDRAVPGWPNVVWRKIL